MSTPEDASVPPRTNDPEHAATNAPESTPANSPERPRPRYGEYAPEGWVPPTMVNPGADNPEGTERAVKGGQSGNDNYSAPGYPTNIKQTGHPINTGQTGAVGGNSRGPHADTRVWNTLAVDTKATRHPVDRAITVLLLVIGAFGALATSLGMQRLNTSMQIAYTQYGIGTFIPGPSAPTIIGIGTFLPIVIYIATMALSVWILHRHRRAFWAPLAGGAVCLIATTVLVIVMIANDPTFLAYMASPR